MPILDKLLRNPKVSQFAATRNYSTLPANWAADKEIVNLAEQAYQELGTQSPWFRAYWQGSQLAPVPWYHGTSSTGLETFNPEYGPSKAIAGFFTDNPNIATVYRTRGVWGDYNNPQIGTLKQAIYDAMHNADTLYRPSYARPTEKPYSVGPVYQTSIQQILKDLANDDYSYAIDYGVPNGMTNRFIQLNGSTLGQYEPILRYTNRFIEPQGEVIKTYIKSEHPLFTNSYGNAWQDYPEAAIVTSKDNITRRLNKKTSDEYDKELETYVKSSIAHDKARFPDMADDLLEQWGIDDFIKYHGYYDPTIRVEDYQKFLPTPKNAEDLYGYPTDSFGNVVFKNTNNDAIVNKNIVDGGTVPSTMLMVRNPTQIKAANNRGTFNPNDPNIYRGIIAGIAANDLPLEDAWNPIESLAVAPVGAASLAGAAGNALLDTVMQTIPFGKLIEYTMSDYDRPLMFRE